MVVVLVSTTVQMSRLTVAMFLNNNFQPTMGKIFTNGIMLHIITYNVTYNIVTLMLLIKQINGIRREIFCSECGKICTFR